MSDPSRLLEVVKDFPEPVLAEVVDFAEFLQSRLTPSKNTPDDFSLSNLAGGLESSQVFNADPLAIQRAMRDEWS